LISAQKQLMTVDVAARIKAMCVTGLSGPDKRDMYAKLQAQASQQCTRAESIDYGDV
jgi:hypothetical protein